MKKLPLILLMVVTLVLAACPIPTHAATIRPLVNGDFEDSPAGQPPAGWTAAYPTGTAAVMKDSKDTFLRLTSVAAENAGVAQLVAVPPGSRTVAVLGRMRGKPQNEKQEKRAAVEVALRYKDAKGAMISAAVVASGNSPNWHTFRRELALPAGCVQIEVVARSLFAIGTFDFDEVRVEFK
jgi:hypothetical protein